MVCFTSFIEILSIFLEKKFGKGGEDPEGHTVFASVVDGWETVQLIAKALRDKDATVPITGTTLIAEEAYFKKKMVDN